MSQQRDHYLPTVPQFAYLIPAILCKANKVFIKESILPSERYWVEAITLDLHKIKAFNQLTAWHHSDIVHPGFLHTVAFPLQLKLMLHKDFPFSMMGIVHIANMIEQYQTIAPTSQIEVCCQLAEIRQLKIGCLFSIETEFFIKQQRVLRAKHQYLRRADKVTKPRTKLAPETDWQGANAAQHWPLPSSLGWQYAKCSQDYNPIHLHPLSAKLLGFKQHIAHGMWMKSRAFSALCDAHPAKLQGALSCDVEFKKPLFLPNSITFQQRAISTESVTEFCISSELNQQTVEHMSGRLEFLDH
ncbi:MaoC family dehydratase [Paraglaciecola hydrolytica]|uniref:MaoC-like domain-containing protein n=1 Tax=Paraglaciecola hydrolytica TaxID=1799789 RepID=A0A136A0D2_9ALTE|nr:MaoC/PaaZ C-terminal domain-containing protein [Paraglaciecola hydrolytica]KXI28685.1 hypothetical protein AX660_16565 [Paraglaciecola hydrolytica]